MKFVNLAGEHPLGFVQDVQIKRGKITKSGKNTGSPHCRGLRTAPAAGWKPAENECAARMGGADSSDVQPEIFSCDARVGAFGGLGGIGVAGEPFVFHPQELLLAGLGEDGEVQCLVRAALQRHQAVEARGLHAALAPYLREAVRENAARGIPVQRPLLLHYEDDPRTAAEQTEYLLGRDLLVAPVYLADQKDRTLYLPRDRWVHLWSGTEYGGGTVCVDAPLGCPPVFYRRDSAWAEHFAALRAQF